MSMSNPTLLATAEMYYHDRNNLECREFSISQAVTATEVCECEAMQWIVRRKTKYTWILTNIELES